MKILDCLKPEKAGRGDRGGWVGGVISNSGALVPIALVQAFRKMWHVQMTCGCICLHDVPRL